MMLNNGRETPSRFDGPSLPEYCPGGLCSCRQNFSQRYIFVLVSHCPGLSISYAAQEGRYLSRLGWEAAPQPQPKVSLIR